MSCPESADVRHDAECCGECQHDSVNHPEHYTQGEIECIDAIYSALGPDGFRDYCRGNALKYLWRCLHKAAPTEDLRKARWYIEKALEMYG